jgi:hypothetical protein
MGAESGMGDRGTVGVVNGGCMGVEGPGSCNP